MQGLLYYYDSAADISVRPTQPDSYSTILQAMQAALRDGKSVVVDVDEAGARALRDFSVPGCYVFVLPESMESLRSNITQALSGDPPDAIERTVAAAEREILAVEESDLYDYGVQNDNEAGALEQIATLADTHGRVAPAVCPHLPQQHTHRHHVTVLHKLQPFSDAKSFGVQSSVACRVLVCHATRPPLPWQTTSPRAATRLQRLVPPCHCDADTQHRQPHHPLTVPRHPVTSATTPGVAARARSQSHGSTCRCSAFPAIRPIQTLQGCHHKPPSQRA